MDAISTTSPISGTTIFKRRRINVFALLLQAWGLSLLVACPVVAKIGGIFSAQPIVALIAGIWLFRKGHSMSISYVCENCRSEVSDGPFCPGCGLEILE